MCGIAGFHLKDLSYVKKHEGLEEFANELLLQIEGRGRQATGLVAVTADTKKVVLDKKPIIASEFIKERKPLPQGTRTVLLHTRYATQGSNDNNENLHPVVSDSCFLIHNGSIVNDDDLFKSHELKRKAEVDTEIIPALINKYGWKDVSKALEELRGGFAIAAIDPVKHPNKVLLARGGHNPLNVYETDKAIIWASTGHAIREAWGKVIGTPPAWKKLESFKEGQILLMDDKTRHVSEFEKPPFYGRLGMKGFSRQGSSTISTTTNGSQDGSDSPATRRSIGNFQRGVITDRRKELKKYRDEGKGKARLHLKDFDKMAEVREEILKDKNITRIVFSSCPSCGEFALEEDFRYLAGEGRVCLDCNDYANAHKPDVVIDKDTKETLERWCSKESIAHDLALDDVAHKVNLDKNTVDYLVFRVPESYTSKTPHIAELAQKLDDLYQVALAEAFDSLFDDFNGDDANSLDEAFKQAVDNDKDKHVKLPNTCEVCRKFKSPDKPCVFCAQTRNEARPTVESVKSHDVTKCWCGKPAEVLLGRIAGFCQRHYESCNIEKCDAGRHMQVGSISRRVDGPGFANHLRQDGKRVCHRHARGEKGIWSDTHIKNHGVVIQRVRQVQHPLVRQPRGVEAAVSEPGGL